MDLGLTACPIFNHRYKRQQRMAMISWLVFSFHEYFLKNDFTKILWKMDLTRKKDIRPLASAVFPFKKLHKYRRQAIRNLIFLL